jgi:diguanylate cyclase (GGDEF)-like protein/PAS domain S-box-containing protein
LNALPWPARVFVAGTIGAAILILGFRAPLGSLDPWLFVTLAVMSVAASVLKLRLPLGSSSSNLSVSYTIDFASLILMGADATMIVAALSACSQSMIRTTRRNPAFRILFNMAALVVTIQAAGLVFAATGGVVGVFDATLIKPLVTAALVYYVLNTFMVATAIGLSLGQPVLHVWRSNFLWTAPSYFVGAGAAAAGAAAWATGWGWFIPLAAAPVYLTFLSYRVYLERITAEKMHRDEVIGLHAQTVQALDAARESEQRYALAANGSHDGLWDWDLTADALYVSDRWKLMLGVPPETRLERSADWFRYVQPADMTDLRTVLDRHLAGETAHFEHEYRMRHQDGSSRWMLCRGVAVRDDAGQPVRMAGSQTDISERRRIQDELRHAALHDSLTGLANRTLFSELLDRALHKARRTNGVEFAVLFIDLDRFKLVNDSLGHMAGDKFLIEIGARFMDHLRPGDVLARLGGDEFAVMLEDVASPERASEIADRLQASLLEPFFLDGREVYAAASIGIAFGSSKYERSDDLLRDADTAMYRAKALGRSQSRTFDPSMHASALRRLTIETQLRRAMDRDEFFLVYQPIIELESREACGFEALIRWTRPDGTIYPNEFIQIAEETGLIVPLTDWVMRTACKQMAEWQQQFDMPLTVTINVASKVFEKPTFVEEVKQAIAESGIRPGTLRIEITEGVLLNDSEQVADCLQALRAIPVELYLDDFGTGFSSLSYLHRYRVDALKIDQSFISRIGGVHGDSPIVSSIVSLAKELGMGVIAEGVETAQQAHHLHSLDCSHAQGYLFSKPMATGDVVTFLAAQSSSAGALSFDDIACAPAAQHVIN